MTTFKTLYHPKFEPSQAWLRGMLLFYDTVHSIVPEKAGYEPSSGVAELLDHEPDSFKPLSPTNEDLEFDWNNYDSLMGVLGSLDKGKDYPLDARARLDRPDDIPRLDFGRAVAVHTGKMGELLAVDLEGLGLARRTEDGEWYAMDRRVADLVLSLLADRMVANHKESFYTSSDMDMSFAVAAKSAMSRQPERGEREAALASAVLTAEKPKDIDQLPINKYQDIRRRYEDQREVFHLAMRDLGDLYLGGNYRTPEELRTQVSEVARKFGQQMETQRKKNLSNVVREWAPIAVGGIVSVAAAAFGDPILAVGSPVLSVSIRCLQTVSKEPARTSNPSGAQALLVNIGRDVAWKQSVLGKVFGWH